MQPGLDLRSPSFIFLWYTGKIQKGGCGYARHLEPLARLHQVQ